MSKPKIGEIYHVTLVRDQRSTSTFLVLTDPDDANDFEVLALVGTGTAVDGGKIVSINVDNAFNKTRHVTTRIV